MKWPLAREADQCFHQSSPEKLRPAGDGIRSRDNWTMCRVKWETLEHPALNRGLHQTLPSGLRKPCRREGRKTPHLSSRKHFFAIDRDHYRRKQPISMKSCEVQSQLGNTSAPQYLRLRDDCRRGGRKMIREFSVGSSPKNVKLHPSTPIKSCQHDWPNMSWARMTPTRQCQHLWLLLKEGQEASTLHKELRATEKWMLGVGTIVFPREEHTDCWPTSHGQAALKTCTYVTLCRPSRSYIYVI